MVRNVMKKGLLPDRLSGDRIRSGRRPEVQYVGIDWAYREAQWCALAPGGGIAGEGRISADRDGLAQLVLRLGAEVKACVEMMSGAVWVRDELVACGWQVEVADARKVKAVAPLAAKSGRRGRSRSRPARSAASPVRRSSSPTPAWRRACASRVRDARVAARSASRARARSAGRPSRRPSRPGAKRTPGTSSTSRSA